MSMNLTGQVKWQDIGMGTWSFVSDDGETYELLDPPSDLTQAKGKVKLEGIIREEVMTTSMIGPVLEVTSYETLG